MKIINGNDYYDCISSYGGYDDFPVFVRNQKSPIIASSHKNEQILGTPLIGIPIEIGFNHPKDKSIWRFHDKTLFQKDFHYYIEPIYVWFCGKRYGIVKIETNNLDLGTRFYHSYEAFENFGKSIGYEIKQNPLKERLHYFFEYRGSKRQTDWFIENKITIAIFDNNLKDFGEKQWDIDTDGLRSIEFFRIKDPFQCYQEIEMFIGGVLSSSGPNIIEISDPIIKIAKHGMDKWSFRKPSKGKNE